MAPKTVRSRSATSTDDDAPPTKTRRTSSNSGSAKAGAAAKAVPVAAAPTNKNLDLAAAFESLMYYETKDGNRWAGKTYNALVTLLRNRKAPVTSGADLAGIAGVGKASVEKIDEFLSTGKIAKLESLRELHGALPDGLLGVGAAPVKSGAKATKASAKSAPVQGSTAAAAVSAVTPAQLKLIAKEAETLASKSIDQLKALLRLNNQIIGGTKGELVERVAQGVVLGAIPGCPLCGGGKLRFDVKKTLYSCPGYMDDDKFQTCFFKSQSVTRSPWKSS